MSGNVNVRKMLRGITATQFIEWECYRQLEPFGDERADWRAASIREVIYNTAVETAQRRPLDSFLISFKDVEEVQATVPQQPWQRMKSIAMMLARAQAVKGISK